MPRAITHAELLDWTISGKYRICKQIGCGSYGNVSTISVLILSWVLTSPVGNIYSGYDILTGEEVAIKLESRFSGHAHLQNECKTYKSLGNYVGIPRFKWFGTEQDYSIMAMTLLGTSLEGLFISLECKFNLEIVMGIAEQMVRHTVVCVKMPPSTPMFRLCDSNSFILITSFTVISSQTTSCLGWVLPSTLFI